MIKKVYYLSSCDSCKNIIRRFNLQKRGFDLQDIKTEKITASQLEAIKQLAGSYEDIFSRRSLQYRARGLKDMDLGEKDFKRLILEEYTFLKRPVVILGDKVFVGSDEKNLAALTKALD